MNGEALLYRSPIELTEARIDRLLGASLQDELVWALRPRLRNQLLAASHVDRPVEEPTAGHRLRSRLRERIAARGRRPRATSATPVSGRQKGPWIHLASGSLRLWNSENQRLAVGAPRAGSVGLLALADVAPSRDEAVALWRSGLSAELEAFRAAFPTFGPFLERSLIKAHTLRAVIRAVLDVHDPRHVVVGSIEQPYTRLLISAARQRGIASVYVPHAPAALNRIYADLPADHNLLASEGDSEHYQRRGASPRQLVVIGDPTCLELIPAQQGDPVVLFAASLQTQQETRVALRALQSLLAGTGIELVASPHPRGRELLESASAGLGISLHAGRTAAAFGSHQVVALVTEAASGSALLGVRARIPVFRWAGPANYAFEEALGIETLTADGTALLNAINLGPSDCHPDAARWSGPVGTAATENRETFLREELQPLGPALDSWGHWG